MGSTLIEDEEKLFLQIIPKRTLESVYLSDSVYRPCAELLDEIEHRDLLKEKGMELIANKWDRTAVVCVEIEHMTGKGMAK